MTNPTSTSGPQDALVSAIWDAALVYGSCPGECADSCSHDLKAALEAYGDVREARGRREALEEWVDHQDGRCEYLNDCRCGLNEEFGLPSSPIWRRT